MSLDSDFLRSVRYRWRWKERMAVVEAYLFEDQTRFLLGMMKRYFKEYKSCEVMDKQTFLTWLFEIKGDTITSENKLLIYALLAEFDNPLTDEAEEFLGDRLADADLVYRAADAIERWTNGEEIEVADVLTAALAKSTEKRKTDDGFTVVDDPISEIMAESSDTFGFSWPLDNMAKAMRPAQYGDCIIVAARPDSGKTSFLAKHAIAWSNQLPELEPDDDRCILWLNNEGPGRRIKLRMYQTVLQASLPELNEFVENGTLEECYGKILRHDVIRIVDVHGKNTAQIERLVERQRPAAIIWDMLDHVKYVSEDFNRNSRTDEYLEGLYKWTRDIGVRHNCVNLISTQLSGDAENLQYPLLGMLKDSKTGKQGQGDAIITLGLVAASPNTRFIGLTKNKLNLGKSTNRLGEVLFDGARGVFKMPENL